MEPRLPRRGPDRVPPVARDAPAGALELDLARLEHVAHEGAGARLELELGGREGQVHRPEVCATRTAGRRTRRGPRDAVAWPPRDPPLAASVSPAGP